MNKLITPKISYESEYIYYNITMVGPRVNQIGDYSQNSNYCRYNVELTENLLEKADEYEFSVVRFTIPMSSVPLFIPEVSIYQLAPNQTLLNNDINLLSYMFCFKIGSNYYRANASWTAQDQTSSFPLSPAQNNAAMNITPYYYCYTYDWIIEIFNNAIITAWTAARTANPSIGTNVPYIYWDASNKLFNFVMPYTMITNAVTLLVNTAVVNLFQGFNWIAINTPNPNTTFADQINTLYQFTFPQTNVQQNGYAIPPLAVTTPPLWVKYQQEFTSISYFTNFNSIVFLSSNLPLQNENLNIGLDQQNSQTPNNVNMISDFVPDITVPGQIRDIQTYIPTIYRMISIRSNKNLYKISLQCFWTDTQNNLYPLILSQSQSASIKLMFRKKQKIV